MWPEHTTWLFFLLLWTILPSMAVSSGLWRLQYSASHVGNFFKPVCQTGCGLIKSSFFCIKDRVQEKQVVISFSILENLSSVPLVSPLHERMGMCRDQRTTCEVSSPFKVWSCGLNSNFCAWQVRLPAVLGIYCYGETL